MLRKRYTSWVRCLTSWEGKRNICPLTKKPLTKRDLGKVHCVTCQRVRIDPPPVDMNSILIRSHFFDSLSVILDFDNIEEFRLVIVFYYTIDIIRTAWFLAQHCFGFMNLETKSSTCDEKTQQAMYYRNSACTRKRKSHQYNERRIKK
jgi:hypothetical protein